MNAAEGAIAVVAGTAFYFKGQTVRIEGPVTVSQSGEATVLCRRWNASTRTVSGFRAFVLVSDLAVSL